MLEGSRTFDILFGLVTGGACFLVASPLLWWSLGKYRVSYFGTRIDPYGRLQLAYGFFGMAQFGADIGCRFIDHGTLPFVHPTFALLTLIYVFAVGPRALLLLVAQQRRHRAIPVS